ncbi:MAG TPA: efflux RND transporter periplasmic adaptor subunit, partial [Steroidobacteraceae bacterium]|nr:efflux RND transporter periplasmic adaptor subunit [Steroidobacteraceae bacterium]
MTITNPLKLLFAAAALAAAVFLAWRLLRPAEVTVVAVAEQRAERILAITGRTRPKVTVTVLPKVAGQVLSLSKEEGDVVAKGELLVQLDSDAPQAAVEQARSAVASQERVLAQAERDYERALSLQSRGLVTLKDFEDARFTLDQARVELERVRATQREISARLGDTRIAAPVSGVVLTRPVDVGQVVDTQSVIYEIAPLKDVEIEAEVDEQFLSEIREGLRAQIGVPGRSRPVAARLSYISPKVDPRIGGAKVRLQFDEPMDDL